MLGPAQNPDGTLKDTDEMEWSHSRSPTPQLPNVPAPDKTNLKKEKKFHHPTRPLTAATSSNKKQRINLTLHDKVRILDFLESKEGKGLTQGAVVKHFRKEFPSLNQSSISRLLKGADEIRNRALDTTQLTFKRPRVVVYPEVEQSLSHWVTQSQARGVRLTGEMIKGKARRFAELHGIPPLEGLSGSKSKHPRCKLV
jgi:hypothetical protein